ncbi:MAG: ABC transporter permease subunit [Clostridiaceae bacterium]|jgi:ABC-2 type transport system permease protein|nr:ABC transporter permease subunit [Clostridiaceae bacterium]
MLAIWKREVQAYFYQPIAYVLIGLFFLVSSIFFTLGTVAGGYAEMNYLLSNVTFILIFVIPILTMRILTEDRKNGTEVLLVTSPASVTQIVLGKYLASFTVFLVMFASTLIYTAILYILGGKPEVPMLIGGYTGFLLLGACFTAIGVFASSLTESQIVSAIISFVFLLIVNLIDAIASFLGGFFAKVLDMFSLLSRYNDLNSGIFDITSIIYYLSFTAVFIFLTTRVIDKRRWSQG